MKTIHTTNAIFKIEEVLEGLLTHKVSYDSNINILCINDEYEEQVNRSLILIKKSYPDFYRLFLNVTQDVFILASNGCNSFADQIDSGSIYLYFEEKPTLGFYIEEVLHQGAHLILEAAIEIDNYLIENTIIDFSKHHHNNLDERSNIVILHSIYTLFCICMGVDLIIGDNQLSEEDELDLSGRLLYASKRLNSDANLLIKKNCLKQNGLIFLEEICRKINSIILTRQQELKNLKLDGQVYNFSSIEFKKRNETNVKSSKLKEKKS